MEYKKPSLEFKARKAYAKLETVDSKLVKRFKKKKKKKKKVKVATATKKLQSWAARHGRPKRLLEP